MKKSKVKEIFCVNNDYFYSENHFELNDFNKKSFGFIGKKPLPKFLQRGYNRDSSKQQAFKIPKREYESKRSHST